jgi:hypothetical protein
MRFYRTAGKIEGETQEHFKVCVIKWDVDETVKVPKNDIGEPVGVGDFVFFETNLKADVKEDLELKNFEVAPDPDCSIEELAEMSKNN